MRADPPRRRRPVNRAAPDQVDRPRQSSINSRTTFHDLLKYVKTPQGSRAMRWPS